MKSFVQPSLDFSSQCFQLPVVTLEGAPSGYMDLATLTEPVQVRKIHGRI